MNAVHKLRVYNDLKTKKIAESERRLHRLLEEMEEAVLILSSDFTLSFANTQARNAFSLSEDAVGRSIREMPRAWDVLCGHLQMVERGSRVEFTVDRARDQCGMEKTKVAIVTNLGGDGQVEAIFVVAR
jgi:PAS domain-containing protein